MAEGCIQKLRRQSSQRQGVQYDVSAGVTSKNCDGGRLEEEEGMMFEDGEEGSLEYFVHVDDIIFVTDLISVVSFVKADVRQPWRSYWGCGLRYLFHHFCSS